MTASTYFMDEEFELSPEMGQVNPFHTTEQFSTQVEELVWKEDISYTEALSRIVERFQIDYEKVKSFLSPIMVEKIRIEAVKTRQLREKKSSTVNLNDLLFA